MEKDSLTNAKKLTTMTGHVFITVTREQIGIFVYYAK